MRDVDVVTLGVQEEVIRRYDGLQIQPMKKSRALSNGNHIPSFTHDVSISASCLDGLPEGGLSGPGKASEHNEERIGGRVVGVGLDGVDVVVGVEQEAVSQ